MSINIGLDRADMPITQKILILYSLQTIKISFARLRVCSEIEMNNPTKGHVFSKRFTRVVKLCVAPVLLPIYGLFADVVILYLPI
jgi:hypothetical protein